MLAAKTKRRVCVIFKVHCSPGVWDECRNGKMRLFQTTDVQRDKYLKRGKPCEQLMGLDVIFGWGCMCVCLCASLWVVTE